MQDARENSVAIFSGRVLEIQTFPVEGYGDWQLVSFEVDRYWKAPDGQDYDHLVVFTGMSENVCGYEFEAGRTYLVYAVQWWHDPDQLYTGLGYRNQPIKSAQQDTAFLGESKLPARQLSIDEQVNRIHIQPLPKGPEEQQVATILSVVGIGAAIAGAVAFFSLRLLRR